MSDSIHDLGETLSISWTSLNHSECASFITEKEIRNLAEVDSKYIFQKSRSQLIDEWQLVPEIWDCVRHECDKDNQTGKFILTGSITLNKNKEIYVYSIFKLTLFFIKVFHK